MVQASGLIKWLTNNSHFHEKHWAYECQWGWRYFRPPLSALGRLPSSMSAFPVFSTWHGDNPGRSRLPPHDVHPVATMKTLVSGRNCRWKLFYLNELEAEKPPPLTIEHELVLTPRTFVLLRKFNKKLLALIQTGPFERNRHRLRLNGFTALKIPWVNQRF